MKSQSKKNQVKHGKYGSIKHSTPPHTHTHTLTHFPLEAIITRSYLGDKKTLPPLPEIYPQNLSIQHLVVRGSKNQQRRRWDYLNFTKGETFLVSKKLSSIWGNLTLYHFSLPFQKRSSSFLQFAQVENIHGHLFEKKTF